MRLINTETMMTEWFVGHNLPEYAIVSHTWGEEEVSFQDWNSGEMKTKKGYAKIHRACHQAIADRINFVWFDTACIDKSSSAELSEAINSQFSWFRDSKICYVYLADVSPGLAKQGFDSDSPFYRSRWFTRGWTLEELIAPPAIHFFDSSWGFIGTKSSLTQHLSRITRIPSSCLTGSTVLGEYSIAERMSWASRRQTTRQEDLAYCLMGLFDVNIHILYGEGGKAFLRLQEEIMKRTSDQSFLAWHTHLKLSGSPDLSPCPIFAESPAYFSTTFLSNRILKHAKSGIAKYQMITRSNIGITFWAPVIDTLGEDLVFAVLNQDNNSHVWIPLWKTGRQSYYRVSYPSMTLYTSGTITNLRIEPSKICLEDAAHFADSSTDGSFNPFRSRPQPTTERSDQERSVRELSDQDLRAVVEVLAAFIDGKQSISKSTLSMYPPIPTNEHNRLAALLLDHGGDGYYHGMLAFEFDSKLPNKTVGLFFAVSVRRGNIRAWTCRVLANLRNASSVNLEAVSKEELAKICTDEKIPLDSLDFESSIWRHRDQNGKTVVELDNIENVIIAKILFDAPAEGNNVSASVSAEFENMKEAMDVVRQTAKMSLGRR
jgi:hypothetical protein